MFTQKQEARHEGTEIYSVVFELAEHGGRYDTTGDSVSYTIRPESVSLVWERELGGRWQRDLCSRFHGHRVLKSGDLSEQRSSKRVYKYGPEHELTKYAASLPDFADLITKIESDLPA